MLDYKRMKIKTNQSVSNKYRLFMHSILHLTSENSKYQKQFACQILILITMFLRFWDFVFFFVGFLLYLQKLTGDCKIISSFEHSYSPSPDHVPWCMDHSHSHSFYNVDKVAMDHRRCTTQSIGEWDGQVDSFAFCIFIMENTLVPMLIVPFPFLEF